MKILFLTLIHIDHLEERGIYQDLVRKFLEEKHEICIVCPTERRNKEKTSLICKRGYRILKVRTLNNQKCSFLEKGISILLLQHQFNHAIKRFFQQENFDLILYSTPPVTFNRVVSQIKIGNNATSYLLLKDIFPQNAVDLGLMRKGGPLYSYFRKKEKKLYAISDYIGCMSPANVEHLLKHNPEIPAEKVEVNPNSIEPISVNVPEKEKKQIRSAYGIPEKATVFIYGGNLGKPQGIDFLMEALERNTEKKNVFFFIVGSGTEYGRIERWMAEKKPANVGLHPILEKKQFDALLAACDVGLIFLDKRFTIPNFPSRLLSYLENHLPVIAAVDECTDVGKILAAENAGIDVRTGDVEGFEAAVDRLVCDRALLREMGENAYSLLLKQYTVEASYERIIEKLLKRDPKIIRGKASKPVSV